MGCGSSFSALNLDLIIHGISDISFARGGQALDVVALVSVTNTAVLAGWSGSDVVLRTLLCGTVLPQVLHAERAGEGCRELLL